MQKSTTQVQRFVAPDMSSALKLLTARFGADAILLASRRVAEGVEVAGLPPGADTSAIEASQIYGERRYSERRASQRRHRAQVESSPAEPDDGPHPQRRSFGESLARLRTDYASLLGDTQASAADDAHEKLYNNANEHNAANNNAANNKVAKNNAESKAKATQLAVASLADKEAGRASAAGAEAGNLRRAASVLARQIDALQGAPAGIPSAVAGALPVADIQLELQALKGLLADSLEREPRTEMLPQPAQYIVLQRLRQMGFSPAVASALLRSAESVQATDALAGHGERQVETLWSNCQAQLLSVLPVIDSDPLAGAGVFALLGPAGAGKTSVIAMLLARFVQRNRAADVAVISLQGARSGLLTQLSGLAGISYLAVDGDFSLASRIAQCARFRTVLIDTGSEREDSEQLQNQLAELRGAAVTINEVLLLPATGEPRYLERIIRQYRGPQSIACVLTFYDQVAALGEILSVLLRERLNIAYLADGTLLPEHLQVPAKQALLDHLVFADESDPGQRLVQQVMAPTINVKVDNATHSMSI